MLVEAVICIGVRLKQKALACMLPLQALMNGPTGLVQSDLLCPWPAHYWMSQNYRRRVAVSLCGGLRPPDPSPILAASHRCQNSPVMLIGTRLRLQPGIGLVCFEAEIGTWMPEVLMEQGDKTAWPTSPIEV